jgi:restriction system protein
VTAAIPPYSDMLAVTLRALVDVGGSASITELNPAVITAAGWTEQQQQVLHGDGPSTEIEYRLAWARTYLKMMGLVTNSSRGVWAVTELGRTTPEVNLEALRREVSAIRRAQRRNPDTQTIPEPTSDPMRDDDTVGDLSDDATQGSATGDWKELLLEQLLALTPDAFERLAQRLLREAGFLRATVTGRSGDGGIDGLGVYQLSLLSFPVFFQCKRYRDSVGAGAVRDFRGAMAGRGDKGLLITTGTFTSAARAEASRDGAPPIDLIDGAALCDLLKKYELGVRTTIRQVEDVVVESEFWSSLAGN